MTTLERVAEDSRVAFGGEVPADEVVPCVLAAGEECYEEAREQFDEAVARHLGRSPPEAHPTDLGRRGWGLSTARADASGRYVLSSSLRASRNLRGYRFPNGMGRPEREEVERLAVRALLELGGPLKGGYQSSSGVAWSPGLWGEPDSSSNSSSAASSEFSAGRGIFSSRSGAFTVEVNEQDHLRAIITRPGDALQPAFRELVRALDHVASSVRRGDDPASPGPSPPSSPGAISVYAHSSRLGFLTANPANLGTAMHIRMTVKLPLLGSHGDDWRKWSAKQGVQVTASRDQIGGLISGVYEVTSTETLGVSEVEHMNLAVDTVSRFVAMEQRLESGLEIVDLLSSDVERTPSSVRPEAPLLPTMSPRDLAAAFADSDDHSTPKRPSRSDALLVAFLLAVSAVLAYGGQLAPEQSSLVRGVTVFGSCCVALALSYPMSASVLGSCTPTRWRAGPLPIFLGF